MFFKKKAKVELFSPLTGELIAMTKVDDPTFREEMLGKGFAVVPSEGKVVSPVDGKIEQMFTSGHAVSMVSNDGVEILIHVGLNTIELKGKYFVPHCSDGDTVKKGDLLIEFELENIKQAGYDTVVPIVVCNSDDFEGFEKVEEKRVKNGDLILELKKK